MKHQLPEHVRLAFARIHNATPAPGPAAARGDMSPEEIESRERWKRARAILDWARWLSRQFPRGLSRVSLYSAERLSLWLEPSGEVKVINSWATAVAKGVAVQGPRDLERVLWGERLDTLAEAILVGTIWEKILGDLNQEHARPARP